MPAGNLLDYVESDKDYKGQRRKLTSRWIGPGPELTKNFLRCAFPPHVKDDRKRRMVRHCRQHLTHLIIGFSEGAEAVEPFRPIAIRTMEHLVAAGMPMDSLQFLWCEHPLPKHSHVHGALVRSILPAGGAYDPALRGSLAIDCSWLASRRLGLSLPTGFARLIRAGEFSYKHAQQERIDKICRKTMELYISNQLKGREQFLEMLDGLDEEVLVSPGADGLPCRWTAHPFDRLYRQSVAIKDPSGSVIWLSGLACRHYFSADIADQWLSRHWDRFKNEHVVYARLRKGLRERIAAQLAGYPVCTDQPKVALKVFDWLDPDSDACRFLALDSMEVSKCRHGAGDFELPDPTKVPTAPELPCDMLDPSAPSIPEAAYPYYSDLSEEALTITDPDILFKDRFDEPQGQSVWIPLGLDPVDPVRDEPAPTRPAPDRASEADNRETGELPARPEGASAEEHRVTAAEGQAESNVVQDPGQKPVSAQADLASRPNSGSSDSADGSDSAASAPTLTSAAGSTGAKAEETEQVEKEKGRGLAPIPGASPDPTAEDMERLKRRRRVLRNLQLRIAASLALRAEEEWQATRIGPKQATQQDPKVAIQQAPKEEPKQEPASIGQAPPPIDIE